LRLQLGGGFDPCKAPECLIQINPFQPPDIAYGRDEAFATVGASDMSSLDIAAPANLIAPSVVLPHCEAARQEESR
jgi:hypothetical protein